jgi:hypothetical protein
LKLLNSTRKAYALLKLRVFEVYTDEPSTLRSFEQPHGDVRLTSGWRAVARIDTNLSR